MAAVAPVDPDRTVRPKLLPPVRGRAAATSAIEEVARLPRARPDALPPGALAMVPPNPDPPAEAPIPPVPAVPADVAADGGACLDRLRKLGVVFEPAAAIKDPGCAVANPLVVKALGSGVSLASAATLNCPTTEAVALWVRDILLPYARDQLRATPTAIVPGSTYACRTRNNQKGARMSEHAKANAFDVMTVEFAGRPPLEIRARGSGDPEGRFQASIRQGSCSYFTTVLGPGSDASHGNHLHFDLAQRRGGYRMCSMGGDRTARGK